MRTFAPFTPSPASGRGAYCESPAPTFALKPMNLDRTLSRFRQSPQRANGEVFHTSLPDLSAEMANTTAKLRQEMGDIRQGVRDERGIGVSVMAFLSNGVLPSYREAKYVCFGVETAYGQKHIRLIEHERFPPLLGLLDRYEGEPRKFRRCFHGLFKAYLRYPGHRTKNATGQRNWLMLRMYLAARVTQVIAQPPLLEWIQVLARHRNLFDENPCSPYGKPLLEGDTVQLDELKQKLGVGEDTWVMSELVLAQIQAALVLDDGGLQIPGVPPYQAAGAAPSVAHTGAGLVDPPLCPMRGEAGTTGIAGTGPTGMA